MVRGRRHGEDPRQRLPANERMQQRPPSRSFIVPASGTRWYDFGKGPAEEELELEMEQDRTSVPVPLYFICPISLEIMKDPVTLCTGQTYDRDNIVKWFECGHRTCPATGQPLRTLELIPNHMLRNLLEEWTVLNERIGVQPVASPQAAAVDPKQVDDLLHQIKDEPWKHEAVKTLHGLASQSLKNQVLIVEQGAISLLASLLYNQAEAEMKMVRTAKGTGEKSMDKEHSSPDRLMQDDYSSSSWTGATEITSNTSSPPPPPDAAQPSASASIAPTRQLEIEELVEGSVMQVPSNAQSTPLSSRSPLRQSVTEEEGDMDQMEQSFVGYLCFPLGRRKHAARPYIQPPAWSSSSKNSDIVSAGKGGGHPQALAARTSVGNTMSRGEAEILKQRAARDSTSMLDKHEAGSSESHAPAMSSDPVEAPRLSDGEKDAALACEEAMVLLNLFPLSHDDRQVIMALTNQGTAISWFLRSQAPLNIKLNALRLMRNLLNLDEVRPVVGSRQSIFIRLLRFVRHDLHPDGLRLVFEILLQLCASGTSSAKNAIEAGTIQALVEFLDSQAVTIANSRVTRSPIIDSRLPLARRDSTVRSTNVVESPTTSAHSLHYIDRTVALAIAQSLQARASRTQPLSATEEIMLNKEIALLVLEKLVANNVEGLAVSAMVKVGIPTLIWHLGKVSAHATEVCASLLVALCGADSSSTVTSDVERARDAAIQAGAINQLVFVVQSGSLRTRQLAAQLLKVLHWKSSSASPSGS